MNPKLYLILLLFNPLLFFGQKGKEMDSISSLLNVAKTDSQRIRLMNALAFRLQFAHADSALKLAEKALNLAESLKNQSLIAACYSILASVWDEKSQGEKAITYYQKSLNIYQSIRDKPNIAKLLYDLGLMHNSQGNYSMAMEFLTRALPFYEEKGDKEMTSQVMSVIGKVLKAIGRLSEALDYQTRAQKLSEETGDLAWMSREAISLGLLYVDMKKYPEALAMYAKAKPFVESSGDPKGKAILYTNIGNVSFEMKDYSQALDYYILSLHLAEQIGNAYGIALLRLNIGSVYQKQGEFIKAAEYYKQAETASLQQHAKDMLMDIYSNSADLYKSRKEFEKALAYHELYSAMRDSLRSEDGNKQVQELTAKYETDKKEKQILSLTRDQALKQLALLQQQTDLNRQRQITLGSLAALLVIAAFSFLLFSRYKLKQKANEQLHAQNESIFHQKTLIEEKNRNITDSINYASRIQTALLPAEDHFRNLFTDSFILFRPKDIVSGDFYWIAETHGKVIYATADCTGHGVPGGFMTMLGSSLLTEIVSDLGITEPAPILEELRKKVILALKQQNHTKGATNGVTDDFVKDGMDIAICCIDPQKRMLTYASAYQDICVISNNDVIELSGDKQPIGYFGDMQKPFTQKSLSLNKGDFIYTFTDGFADQFGGPKGKKFKYKRLIELLRTHHSKKASEQKQLLEECLDDWRGGLEQIDDICLIGVKI
jgi:serine phosphatase RsbU (regulator of sigma subunit)